jgi:hypothetical protein
MFDTSRAWNTQRNLICGAQSNVECLILSLSDSACTLFVARFSFVYPELHSHAGKMIRNNPEAGDMAITLSVTSHPWRWIRRRRFFIYAVPFADPKSSIRDLSRLIENVRSFAIFRIPFFLFSYLEIKPLWIIPLTAEKQNLKYAGKLPKEILRLL